MGWNDAHWQDYILRLDAAAQGKCLQCGGENVEELSGDGMECAPTGYHCPDCGWGVGS